MISKKSAFLISAAFVASAPVHAGQADAPAPLAAPDEAADAEGSGDSAIVVTGVRGTRQRTVANSPVPIDVIGPEQLTATGRTGLKEVLGSLIPSFTMPAQGGGGTSASVRPITIRGLSGDYLLVLVNGKRRHTTGIINNLSRVAGGSTPVDIDLIATSSIGRLEVLRDGAAAQYGSDAISGVINLILDSSPTGGTFETTVGQNYDGDGALIQQAVSYGTRLGDDGGFIRFSGEAKYHDPASRGSDIIGLFYPRLPNGDLDPREATVDRQLARSYGRSNRDVILNGSYNAELPLGDNLTLYSFSTLSYRNIKDARGVSPANRVDSLPQIYPNGYNRYRRIYERDFQATFGLRGLIGAFDYDLSSSYGQDHARLGAENTLNPSIGPTSKTSFYLGKLITDLWVNNLDLSRSFDIGFAEPLAVSFGVEHRWEQFRSLEGEPDSYRQGDYVIPKDDTAFGAAFGGQAPAGGVVSFVGTSPNDVARLHRNNVAAYVDLATSITKEWFVGIAGRAEHYDDSSGNTVSGKFSTRYEILPGLAIRGGVNTGFRAPSLAQQGFSTTQNTSTILADGTRQILRVQFIPVDRPEAILLGAKPLKPEKSLNFTGGITYESPGGLRLTVDAYQIDIDDRIVKTEFLRGAAVQAILTTQGFNDLSAGQYFTNAIDTRTRGVDVVGEYTLRTADIGTIRLNAAYSYNKTTIRHVIDNPPELVSLGPGYVLFGRQAQRDLLVSTPRDKLAISADWSLGRFNTNLRGVRYGKYTESGPTETTDTTFNPKWIVDIDVSYSVTDTVTFSVGANNLFDTYPARIGIISNEGIGQYGSFSPYGLTGGFYYARASFRI